jgi:hypothetical protein
VIVGWDIKMATRKEILQEARENYDEATAMFDENVQDSIKSSRAVDGNQWAEEILAERKAKDKATLTINLLRKFVLQISGEIRQNMPDMEVVSSNSSDDAAGATIRSKMLKYIEQISKAEHAYSTAVLQALEGGFAWWRIITAYRNNDSFDQDIMIQAVPNRFDVIMDQHAKEKLYEDAEFGFMVSTIPQKTLLREYGVKRGVSYATPVGTEKEGWYTKDNVRIAEYFWKEYTRHKLLQISDNVGNTQIMTESAFRDFQETFPDQPFTVVRERVVHKPVIKWVKMTRQKIMEGPITFPGEYIPFIPMLGYEHNDQGYRRFRSLVFDAIDAMKIFNYWRTMATETIAMSQRAPYLVTLEQIKGYEEFWKQADKETYPFLFYNYVPNLNKPSREPPVQLPAAMLNEANMAAKDIQDITGMYAPTFGEPSNERSGRAIIARQAQANNTIFPFIQNFQDALIHSENMILKMMPTIYDTQRIIRVMGTNGLEDLRLNYPTVNLGEMFQTIENDMSGSDFHVVPTVGVRYATKRQMEAASMLDFLQFAPHTAPIVLPKLAKAMDWEGADAIALEMQQLTQQNPDQPGTFSGSAPAPGNTALSQAQTVIP